MTISLSAKPSCGEDGLDTLRRYPFKHCESGGNFFNAFPGYVRMRIHRWGHIDIPHGCEKSLKGQLDSSFPGNIGNMTGG